MNKLFFNIFALSFSLTFALLNLTATPPSFPSSSQIFIQKSEASASNKYINYQQLPCFRVYEELQKFLRYPTSIVTFSELLSKVDSKTLAPADAHKQFVAGATKMIYLATDVLQKSGSYNN